MGKKVKFLGIEFNIIDDEDIRQAKESGEESVYSVIRLRDADPLGGSPQLRARRTIVYCDGCHRACFLDPLSYAEIAVLNPTIICLQCTVERAQAEHN